MQENEDILLTFDNSVREKVTASLGFNQNDKGELIGADKKVITNQDLEPIKLDEFGGVLKGSKIAIKKKDTELVKYFVSR